MVTVRLFVACVIGGVILAFANGSLGFGAWAMLGATAVVLLVVGFLTIPGAFGRSSTSSEPHPR